MREHAARELDADMVAFPICRRRFQRKTLVLLSESVPKSPGNSLARSGGNPPRCPTPHSACDVTSLSVHLRERRRHWMTATRWGRRSTDSVGSCHLHIHFVAPDCVKTRSTLAKKFGLGRKGQGAPKRAARMSRERGNDDHDSPRIGGLCHQKEPSSGRLV